jgi:ABC-type sugar transport system substrate-binding protein
MKKMFKKLLIPACLLLVLGALVGCSGGDSQGTQGGSSSGSSVAWQNVSKISGLQTLLEDSQGESSVLIPQFANADGNSALEGLNIAINSKCDEIVSKMTDATGTVTVVPFAMDTDNALSLVLLETDTSAEGEVDYNVTSYVYDKTLDKEMTLEYAMSNAGITDDDIAGAMETYSEDLTSNASDGTKYIWQEFTIDGFFIDDNGKAGFLVDTIMRVSNGEDSSVSTNTIYIFENGSITGELQ